MADPIYQPSPEDDPNVDPRLLRAALDQNAPSIFSSGYKATPTSAPGDEPSIYGTSTGESQGPVKPAGATHPNWVDDVPGQHMADVQKTGRWPDGTKADFNPYSSGAREGLALRASGIQEMDRQETEQAMREQQAPLVAAHAKWFSGEGRQTGGAGTFAAENAKAMELFADDPDGYKEWFKRKTERSQATPKAQTFVSHTPEGDKLFEKDPVSGKYRESQTEEGAPLVKPPPPQNFQAIPTDKGLTTFNTKTGATGAPNPDLNRVQPEPPATPKAMSPVDVQTIHDRIQSEIDHKYPIVDAKGHRTDDVAALRLQNQREREAGIAPGMRPAPGAAPSPISPGAGPGRAAPNVGPPTPPRSPASMDASSLHTPIPPAAGAGAKYARDNQGNRLVSYDDWKTSQPAQ